MAETQYGTFHKRTSTAEFLSSTDWIQYIDTTGDTASTSNEYTPNKNNSLTKYLRTLAANVAGISGNTINNGTVGQLAYYSAQGTLSGYTGVTTALLKTISDWFDTVKDTDTDANINRWNEIVDFLNNFTEADTLASILSTYVTLGSEQTITGVKTFSNPISGDILGNATTADRLKSTTAVGSASLPVYFTGGLPVVCTASSIFSALSSNTTNAVSITVCGQTRNITPSTLRTSLGLGTVYNHSHTDYVTNVSFDDTNRKLQLNKGDGTATDIVTFGTAYSKNIDNSTAGYAAYYSAASTVSGTSLLLFGTNIVTITSSVQAPFEIYLNGASTASAINFYSGTTKTLNGYIGIGGSASSRVAVSRPYWGDGTYFYLLVHSTAKTAVGSSTTAPVYINANGQAEVCTSLNINTSGTAAGLSATIANDKLPTRLQANHTTNTADPTECGWYYASSGASGAPFGNTDFLIMAQGYNATWATEIATDFRSNNLAVRNKNTGTWNSWNIMVGTLGDQTITGNKTFTGTTTIDSLTSTSITTSSLTASGTVNLSGSTTIDSLTAGNLVVNGNSSLTGNVSMGTVTAGTWNGSVIDVAHGGTGCSTLTSGYALIGNGTGAVTFRNITNNTSTSAITASTNLITANTLAYWNGAYSGTSSRLAYCNQGAFGNAATRTYATAIAVGTGTASATANNHASDVFVPTTKAVYNFVTSTLGVATTISKTSITKSLNSSTWTETGYTLYGEEQGSYMLQITDTTTAAVFTGVFSIYHGSSATGNDLDEIPLHMCASATNKVRIYAATLNGKLLVSSQDTSATNHALTIKYKKII